MKRQRTRREASADGRVRPEGQSISEADIIVVDGRNTFYRALHSSTGNLGLVSREGKKIYTGAIYGFFQSVLAVAKKAEGADVFICWEGSKQNRKDIVPEYKENRKVDERLEELFRIAEPQLKRLKEILLFTAWEQVNSPKWEADDVIATIARRSLEEGQNVLILSNDGDLHQCLRESNVENPDKSKLWCRQYAVKKSDPFSVYTEKRLLDDLGIRPDQVSQMKGLAGDSSDGYKGAPGVGQKTAAKWLKKFESIEGIFEAIQEGELSSKAALSAYEFSDYVVACEKIAVTQPAVRLKFESPTPNQRKLTRELQFLKMHSLCIQEELDALLCVGVQN